MSEKTIDIPIAKKVKFKIGKPKPFDFDCDHPTVEKIMNIADFNVALKREYKKWKDKYYSAKAQSDYEKMERCHKEMQRILKCANKEQTDTI